MDLNLSKRFYKSDIRTMEGTNLWTFLVLFHLRLGPSEPAGVILGSNRVYEGDRVTLNCNADVAGVSRNIKYISRIDISRRVPSEGMQENLIVQYRPFSPKRLYLNLPKGRDWKFRYDGGNKEYDTRDMKATLHIRDTRVADAGFYLCTVTVINVDGYDKVFRKEQELKVDF